MRIGDFNYPEIDWRNGTTRTVKMAKMYKPITRDFMVPFIEVPTRKHLGSSDHSTI